MVDAGSSDAGGDIAFVVNRCGPPLPWDETVLFEIENDLEAEGRDPEIIQEVLRLKRIIWKYYVDASTDSALATGTQRDEISAALSALYARAVDSDSLGLPQALQDYDAESYARRALNVSYDPTPFLEEIEPPLLCVFGENDINVPTAKSVAALERLTREFERDITFKVYPDVGHCLFSVKGIFTAGFTGDYLDLIGNWARDHTAAK